MPLDETRVLIVGDSPLARAGLMALLQAVPGLIVAGQAAEPDLSAALAAHAPDVIAWDTGWDANRALEQLTEAREAAPPILALLADAGRALDALNAGARGVLLQETDPDVLAAALTSVARGLVVLAPDLMPSALLANGEDAAPQPDTLTPRELEVLTLLAEGLPNKSIASRLSISEHTVKFHVNAVMSKLGAQSRTEAVVRATRLGLIVL